MIGHRRALPAAALLAVVVALAPVPAAAQRPPAVASIQVSPQQGETDSGRTFTFYATAYDAANNAMASVTDFEWSSSNSRVATIDKYGTATAHSRGRTVIRARVGRGSRARTGRATLTVVAAGGVSPEAAARGGQGGAARGGRPAPGPRATGPGCVAQDRQPAGTGTPEALLVDPLRVVLVKGETKQLEFRAVRADGANAERVCLLFTTDPGGERIVQVDSSGRLTALGDTGRAMLRVQVPGNSRLQKLVSVEVRADSVGFNVREVSLAPGALDTLRLVVPAQERTLDPLGIFQFTSSDTTKVRVSPGLPIVTAIAPGTARITAASSIYPDIHATVMVHKPIVRLVGTPAVDTIVTAVNGAVHLGYRLIASDSSVVEAAPVRWSAPDSLVARFDSGAGTLRGVQPGRTAVAVAVQADRDSVIVRRWQVRVVAGGLAIATPRFALGVGDRRPLTVELLDENRAPLGPAPEVRWTSSDSAVASIGEGAVVGVGMGHAVLTARSTWDSTAAADVYVVGDLLLFAARSGRWNVYLTDRRALSSVRPLTQDTLRESELAWSPDWRRVAYTAAATGRSDYSDLYVANADGSDPVRLTDDSAKVSSPSFVGPSGEELVFESNRGTGEHRAQLYAIKVDGSGRHQLTRGASHSQPDVSPDGTTVLYVALENQHYNVCQMSVDGSGQRRLTNDSRRDDAPEYAADGRSFYFLRLEGGRPPTRRVYRQDLAAGAAAVPVTPNGVYVQAYSVSPDGGTLALTVLEPTRDGSAVPRVELFDVATQTARRVAIPGLTPIGGVVFRPARQVAPQP